MAAADAFRRVLASRAEVSAIQRQIAADGQAKALARIAHVDIIGTEKNDVVEIDGAAADPKVMIDVDPGRHRLVLIRAGTRRPAREFVAEDGQRVCLARFALYGQEVELAETGGDDPDDRLLHRVGNMVREAMGLPTELDRTNQLSAERDIISAAAGGHVELAATLGRELVMRNAAAPRMLSGRTRLGQRETF